MSIVNVSEVQILPEPKIPARFSDPFFFKIKINSVEDLKDDLEWTLTYVGSADSAIHDQQLSSVLVGPIQKGEMQFVLEAQPPNLEAIPSHELVGVTVILLTCLYSGREFLRIGYYLHVVYEDKKYMEYRRAQERVPEEDLGDDDEEEDDNDAMETEENDDDMAEDDAGDDNAEGTGQVDDEIDDEDDDSMVTEPNPAEGLASKLTQQHQNLPVYSSKPEAVKIIGPREWCEQNGEQFDRSKLMRSILEEPRGRTFDVDWNHPWNASLKSVYQAGAQQGKPTQIVPEEWLAYLQSQVMQRSPTEPLNSVDREWALQAWQEMLRHDPGSQPRTFDWLEDVELPKESDIMKILEHQRHMGSKAPSANQFSPFRG